MQQGPTVPAIHKKQTTGETFCGADRGTYKWSQTISDLDVIVPVSTEITSGSNVRVDVTSDTLKVGLKPPEKEKWDFVVKGKLQFGIRPNEFMWSLDPGKQVSVHLEKCQERWWESLLENEPKLNLEEYELSRPISELSEEEEMTLHKIWKKQLDKINHPEGNFR